MSMLNRLKQWFSGGRAGNSDFTDNLGGEVISDAIDGLDFSSAIQAHEDWKRRLLAVINDQAEESPDPAKVACDNCCVLGKWIHGPGKLAHGSSPMLFALRTHHAHFHKAAALVLEKAQKGERDAATEMLTGEFSKTSALVKDDLLQLYLEARSKHRPQQGVAIA